MDYFEHRSCEIASRSRFMHGLLSVRVPRRQDRAPHARLP